MPFHPEAIRARGADYLIAVKTNWPNLHGEIERFFAAPSGSLDRAVTTDGDHGRIETRRHLVSHDVGWLYLCRWQMLHRLQEHRRLKTSHLRV